MPAASGALCLKARRVCLHGGTFAVQAFCSFAVVNKKARGSGFPVDMEQMLLFAAAPHALVFVKAVVAACVGEQINFV